MVSFVSDGFVFVLCHHYPWAEVTDYIDSSYCNKVTFWNIFKIGHFTSYLFSIPNIVFYYISKTNQKPGKQKKMSEIRDMRGDTLHSGKQTWFTGVWGFEGFGCTQAWAS